MAGRRGQANSAAGRLPNQDEPGPTNPREIDPIEDAALRETFNADFYLANNPDVAAAGVDPFQHFVSYGRDEGRAGVLPISTAEGRCAYDAARKTIAVAVHDGSLTGAPIVGYNIVKLLSETCNVIAIVMHDGPIIQDFLKYCVGIVRPIGRTSFRGVAPKYLAEMLIRPLTNKYGPISLIANSAETESMMMGAKLEDIPTLSLVHEFSDYVAASRMRNVISCSGVVVFPAQIVLDSAKEALGQDWPSGVVLPQGKCEKPDIGGHAEGADLLQSLTTRTDKQMLLCIGCGSVQLRKGVDLFVATAAKVAAELGNDSVRFIWIGDGYLPDLDQHFSSYLRAQVQRSGLENVVYFVPAVGWKYLERAYRAADVMLLSSRLDPFPNVAIEAADAGLPIVCFDKASGTAEQLAELDGCSELVVPYLDVHAAANAILKLAREPDLRRRNKQSLKTFVSRLDMRAYVERLRDLLDELVITGEQSKHAQAGRDYTAISER
jgi:glycosyltransferase involved in cell wall biosynthesis